MRRLISYILMSGALLLGVAASFSPTIVNLNTDLAYSDGRTLTFRLSEKSTEKDGYDPELNLTEADGTEPVETVAKEMRSRLDTWGLSEYSVETVGYNTVNVSVRTTINSDKTYSQLENYLSFSGGNISLDSSNDTNSSPYEDDPAYAFNDRWNTILDGQTARIEYITQGSVPSFPVVVVPIGDNADDIAALTDLVKYCSGHSKAASTDDSGNETSAVTVSLVLWANRLDTDFYSLAEEDANVASRILLSESCSIDEDGNSNAYWYASTDEDKEYPSLQLIPSSDAITSEGKYDSSKANVAYQAAASLMNTVNAAAYDYRVDFLYSSALSATVENLISFSDWHVSAAFSSTLIAVLVSFAVICILLALFDRIYAIGEIAVSTGATFLTLVFFSMFGAQFNIAALLGLLVIELVGLFGGRYYASRLKDELYKGRSLKKANSEAAKKAFWPTIDASVAAIIIGVFVFIFAGDLASKFGVVLVIGGFVTVIANLLFLRIANWLLCNDNGLQTSFPKMLNVDASKIPNMLKEERQTYFGPYEKTNFTKGKKWIYGVMGAMIVAGIATMISFGVINGTVYNDTASTQQDTIIYVESRSTASDSNNNDYIKEITTIYDGEGVNSILEDIVVDGKTLGSYIDSDGVQVSATPQTVFDSDTKVSYYWYYYSAKLTTYFDPDATSYTITVTGSSDNPTTVSEALSASLYSLCGGSATVKASVMSITPSEGTPYLGNVSLGVGVGLAVALLYFLIRYRPSRGLAATLVALAASYTSLAFFVFTRISVTPIVALGSIAVAVYSLLVCLYILAKEKDIYQESREKEKNTLAFRSQCLEQANSRGAGDVIIFALLAAYLGIAFFGIGPSIYGSAYLNLILGIAFSTVMVLGIMSPLALRFAKWFSLIKLPHLKRKKKTVGELTLNKKKSAEPEEAIFIGIND